MKPLKDSKHTLLKHHLLSVEDLSIPEIDILLNKAKFYADANKQRGEIEKTLKELTIITLFFETSTRTKTSFELAAKRLGADLINVAVKDSSINKGETLLDTMTTINSMSPDVLIVRHPEEGISKKISKIVNACVINAGDGRREHPTQALLDALTIKNKFKKWELARQKYVVDMKVEKDISLEVICVYLQPSTPKFEHFKGIHLDA